MDNPNTETPASSSNTSIQPTPIPFALTPSTSLQKSSTSKLDYLYEVNYVSNDQKVTSKDLPLINHYHAFTKPINPINRSFRQLMKHTPETVKEYI